MRRLLLAPLSTDQVFTFIEALCKQVSPKSRLREDIKGSPLFNDMPKSPIAAILLAEVLNQKVEELPSTLPELYSKYFELMLGRWEIEKGLRSQKEYEALDAILMNLAEYFMNNQLASMSLDEVRETFFHGYLKKRNLELDPDDLLQKAIARCGIIYANTEAHHFAFRHRTFVEFLFARKAVINNQTTPLSQNVFTIYWSTSVYFYVGLLKDCPEVIENLSQIRPNTELGQWLKMDFLGSFLLAAYQTPYETITDSVRQIASDMGQYCSDVLGKQRDTELRKFPPMLFLMIAQYGFANKYGYSFLKPALQQVIEELATDQNESQASAYALFLLSTALDKAGGDEMFLHLLESYKELPMILRIAIHTASTKDGQTKKNSPLSKEERVRKKHLLKKHNAKISKAVKKTKGTHAFYESCFTKPIQLLKI